MSTINTKWPYPITKKDDQVILDLIEQFNKPRPPVIFIGSGFGKEAIPPLPTGGDLVSILRDELGVENNDENLAELLQYLQNRNVGSKKVVIDWLKEKLLDGKSEPGGAHRLLFELPLQEFFTTNYDSLLEDACRQMNYKLKIIDDSSSFKSNYLDIKGKKRIGVLGHLHGRFENESNIVATSDDYIDEYVNQEANWSLLIEDFFKERRIIFIGYSLKDFTTWTTYNSVRSKYKKSMYPHYLVSPINSNSFSDFWGKYGITHIPLTGSQFLAVIHDKMGKLDNNKEVAVAAAAARIGETYDETINKLEILKKECHFPDIIISARYMMEEGLDEK